MAGIVKRKNFSSESGVVAIGNRDYAKCANDEWEAHSYNVSSELPMFQLIELIKVCGFASTQVDASDALPQ
ncbi:MAG: hypothetical protein ACR2HX_16925 [Pyrinomonadaceae bacterium]